MVDLASGATSTLGHTVHKIKLFLICGPKIHECEIPHSRKKVKPRAKSGHFEEPQPKKQSKDRFTLGLHIFENEFDEAKLQKVRC